MKSLRQHPTLGLAVPAFRAVANLEALSWIGLLIGMLFKYRIAGREHLGESLVTIFGSVHGALVIVYVALAALVALRLGWSLRLTALAVLATIPPFATVAFDWWAHSRDRYESSSATSSSSSSSGLG